MCPDCTKPIGWRGSKLRDWPAAALLARNPIGYICADSAKPILVLNQLYFYISVLIVLNESDGVTVVTLLAAEAGIRGLE